ncbi:MAG: phosphoribosylglycinamide synthetase C domain-containing protein, partial [Planctomycetota bacterium]
EGRRFQGVLFAGLILTAGGPKVLEYNVRFGDPECQVLMMRFADDLVPYLEACARGKLDELEAPAWDPRPACGVVLASAGYPGSSPKGLPIEGIDELELGDDLQVFQAGTARDAEGRLVTAGGRVLTVTALGEDMHEARARAYAAAEKIQFEGKTQRSDIGLAAAERLERMR